MKKITFTTPTGSTVELRGNRPYFSIKCNFHATMNELFMQRLESEFNIRSISVAFREQYSCIRFSCRFGDTASDVADKIRAIVEKYLI